MSADRWSYCPRCRDAKACEIEDLVEELKEKYGKVTIEEYGVLLERLEAARLGLLKVDNDSQRYEFREDWGVGSIGDGIVIFGYSGSCSVCDLRVEFTYEHPFYSRGNPG